MSWLVLGIAIVTEVCGTLSLRMAAKGSRWWYVGVAAGYGIGFTLLAIALRMGIPIGVAYGIWMAVGVVLTALASRFLFKEPFTWIMGAGIVLIAAGVLVVDLGGH